MKTISIVTLLALLDLSLCFSNPYETFMEIEKRDTSAACWIRTYGRGVGRPITTCRDGLEKSGLLCYPPCATNYTGVGPVCWGPHLKSYGRGVGRPLGCGNGTEYDAGLCYQPCRDGYRGVGPVCWETCPFDKPFQCGLVCTADKATCTNEMLGVSMAGFSVLYGIGTIGAAIAAGVGTAGLLSVLAAFGIIAGGAELGSGALQLSAQLVGYPFCMDPADKNKTIQALNMANSAYQKNLVATCQKIIANPGQLDAATNAFLSISN